MLEFFIDPVLRGPTLGSMLMCLASGLIGCLILLRRRSLIGEALSHATYPGVMVSALVYVSLFPASMEGGLYIALIGAFVSGWIGLFAIGQIQTRLRMSGDAAICFVLSIFFGVGVLAASCLQAIHPMWVRKTQNLLFGQAATMGDEHILVYGILAISVVSIFVILYRFLEVFHFDSQYAHTLGIPIRSIEVLLNFLLILSVVMGMRSVGVVLMSAMLIAPPVAARQWTNRFSSLLILSGLFALFSGFLGSALSVWIPGWLKGARLAIPTGPIIVLSAAFFAFVSLLFAPQRGFVIRMGRICIFRIKCAEENILKACYKGEKLAEGPLAFLMYLQGWIDRGRGLTPSGRIRGQKLVRLHRLWEVYLVHMGQGVERVHRSAEEMEHILTPEIERQLQALLDNPRLDPHQQPIPADGGI